MGVKKYPERALRLLRQNPPLWDLYTRKEEYDNRIRDQYDRFPHFASNCRDIFTPHASRYLHDVGHNIDYPDDKTFAVCLTHDIDEAYRSIPFKGLAALGSLRNSDIQGIRSALANMRSKKLPLCNFSEIMDLEECYGGSSTFFFLALEDGDPDHAFNIEDLEGEIGTIINRGWEVGLHGGHDAYNNPEKIREEKKRLEDVLGRPPVGYRNHYLRFRVPETWEYIREAGFKYDTTFGYADCIGFRNGMCHPFIPYNLSKNQSIDLLEIPLAIMDCTFDLYMKLDASQAWEITKQVIDTVEQCHGVMTILWHNTYMRGEQLRMYHKILDYCSGKDAWLTNGAALCNHFMRD